MGQGKGGVMSETGRRWGHEWDRDKLGSWVGQGKGGVMSGTGKRWGQSGTGKRWGHEWDKEKGVMTLLEKSCKILQES